MYLQIILLNTNKNNSSLLSFYFGIVSRHCTLAGVGGRGGFCRGSKKAWLGPGCSVLLQDH